VDARTLVVVGCLNRQVPYFPAARGKGIAVLSFDEATGTLSELSEETATDNPNYLEVDEVRRCIYAVGDMPGRNHGVAASKLPSSASNSASRTW